MPVYVDTAQHEYGRMKMCHMLADSLPELLAMADRIGVARRWYQGPGKASCPHFDIAQSKRALALAAGAVELTTNREVAELTRRIKADALVKVRAGEAHGWDLPS